MIVGAIVSVVLASIELNMVLINACLLLLIAQTQASGCTSRMMERIQIVGHVG